METNLKWLEQFKANYANETKEAQMVMGNLSTLGGKTFSTVYAKWGLMELAMTLQDPNSSIVVKTFTSPDNPSVASLVRTIKQDMRTVDKGVETFTTNYTHMIELEATFLGKTMVEHYPVINTSHEHINILKSNDINTAIQRGKARLIARITGIAFELYTQYTWDEEEQLIKGEDLVKTPKVAEKPKGEKKEAPKARQRLLERIVEEVKEEVKEPLKDEVKNEDTSIYSDFATFIVKHKDNEVVSKAIGIFNQTLKSKQNVEIVSDDSVETIVDKINGFEERLVKGLLENLERRVK